MFSLTPRDRKFHDLFEKSAAILVAAAATYGRMVRDYGRRDEHVARIRQLEHDGDDCAQTTFEHLDRTFLTPFDREDIAALTLRMDDVIDEIDAAAKRLKLYDIPAPTKALLDQTDVLMQICDRTGEAIRMLRNYRKQTDVMKLFVEIHRLENVGDDVQHAAAADLYRPGNDPLTVMKWKEIHDITERAIDRCEDIANLVRSIMLKNG